MNQSSLLYQLQQIDCEIDICTKRINEIEVNHQSDTSVLQATGKFNDAKNDIVKKQIILKSYDEEVKETQSKIQMIDSNLYSGVIKNPKELQDLQIELESFKRRLETLEENELSALIVYEDAQKYLASKETELNKTISSYETEKSLLLGEKETLNKKISRLTSEKNAAGSSISSENMIIYNKLRKSKIGIAVSLVEENTCTICGSNIRPAELQAARSPKELSFCLSCGRILFAG